MLIFTEMRGNGLQVNTEGLGQLWWILSGSILAAAAEARSI
jgi:hypothetical protein